MSDNSILYVRKEMLSEQAPPASNIGLIGWMRTNLFSDIFSSILTLLAIAAAYLVLSELLPWVFGGVWNATTQGECREVLHELRGEHAEAACWGVIHERFWQLMYGFFPSNLYWRPNLALVLLFGAIAPVLFNGLPKQMFLVTIAFPFVAPWLLWGGPVWTPVMAFMGFVIGVLVHKFGARAFGSLIGLILGVLAALVWWIFFASMVSTGISNTIGASRMGGEAARMEAGIPEQRVVFEEAQAVEAPFQERFDAIEADLKAARAAEAPVAALIAAKTPAKISLGGVSTIRAREEATLKSMERRLKLVTSLDDNKAKLVELTEAGQTARAALPDSVRDILNIKEVPDGTDKADIRALKSTIKIEDKVFNLDNSIATLYTDVGLVGLEPVASREFGGFMLAILLGITGISLSLPIGIVLALGRQADLLIVKALCVGFIEFIRGVPLITLLFVASVLLNLFLPKGTEFDIILRVMIMITLFASAYMAEVIRGGLAALPTGQYEAADALGLDYWQAQRLIIMPQALKISIPSIVSNFIGLFKDTTLVSIIALSDPIGWVRFIQGNAEWNSIVWELYGFVAFVFFLFCFSMSRYSMYLERKLQTGH